MALLANIRITRTYQTYQPVQTMGLLRSGRGSGISLQPAMGSAHAMGWEGLQQNEEITSAQEKAFSSSSRVNMGVN